MINISLNKNRYKGRKEKIANEKKGDTKNDKHTDKHTYEHYWGKLFKYYQL